MTVPGDDRDVGDGMEAWLRGQLLNQRQVVLRGPLDDEAASRVAAELMLLDATGDSAVQMQIDSPGGPLRAALTLVDTIGLMGVPVRAACVGRVEGSAVAVLAAAEHRSASRHASFHLSEPSSSASGTAGELSAWSRQRQIELDRLAGVLSTATGRPLEHVEADISAGRWLDAEQALAYGLVHDILGAGRGTPPDRGRPFGFGPH
ncbi:ATP-dependent Clp protease proteolytic subunit [Acidiferrimicrobium sp. IK]|uniref:ATP-dependent Clp protease proteolytic subunit n=1 Tax=Acidiferrimicrobium sp. IK TaxID=2871700 RepID=UPI0021CB3016|nr:ATP-dependent Clp protease proteolytic subunit [Acidiferrimicrobium sp. IK]MCU4186878.1 ATP-dependent Clp protease proteolytic subunit [Acidiferrimicrobium sp. IK]